MNKQLPAACRKTACHTRSVSSIPSSIARSSEPPVSNFTFHISRFTLLNTDGFWELTFLDQPAILRQNQALFYVAFLLAHPGIAFEPDELAEAVYELLLIAASQIYELLNGFDPELLKQKLAQEPLNYLRLVMALTRLSEGGLKYEQYRAALGEKGAERKGFARKAVGEMERVLKLM